MTEATLTLAAKKYTALLQAPNSLDDWADMEIVRDEGGQLALHELAKLPTEFSVIRGELEARLGFKEVRLVDTREAGYTFDANRDCPCPLCASKAHESAWYCVEIMRGVVLVKNISDSCRQRELGWEGHQVLQTILRTPDCDAPYVDLFQLHFGHRLLWSGKKFLYFRKHLWRTISTEEVYNCLSSLSAAISQRLARALAQRRTDVELYEPSEKEKIRNIKEQYAGALRGVKYVNKNANIKGLLEMAKNRLYRDVQQLMDNDTELLGTDNGVIELKKGGALFRAGRAEEYVSKSVGYEYFDDTNEFEEGVWDSFSEFVKQIYPVDEEREVAQRYFGYSLLGAHPEKKACLLTDARGGNNGKSTITKALLKTLGEYGTKAKKCLLNKADSNHDSINGHDAGLIAFHGVRAAVLEELDGKNRLDNSFFKDITGGNSSLQVRRIGTGEVFSLTWTAKLLICFNNQCMPHFDYTDVSLLQRMLLLSHRSRFCYDLADYEQNKNEPYTFKADTNIDEKLTAWRPYMLKWCLEGLAAYYEKSFSSLPATCSEWLQELVSQQDCVAEFLQQFVEKVDLAQASGSQEEYVTRAVLYRMYKQETPEERNPKTCLGKAKFLSELKKRLGEGSYKARHGKNARDAFVGWRLKDECVYVENRRTASASEDVFRNRLQAWLQIEFKQGSRPVWLEGLELDLYHEPAQVAIEYNGPHHDTYPNQYHKSLLEFKKQQANDKKKKNICKARPIHLLIVKSSVIEKEMADIEEQIQRLPDTVRRQLMSSV